MSIDRREFLKLGGIGVAGVLFVPLVQGCERHVITPLGEPESTPFLTPTSQFFSQNGGEGAITGWTEPTFNAATDWSLQIKEGNTLLATVTWDDLMSAAQQEAITILKSMECVLQSRIRVTSTGFTGNAYWTGVPLKFFLDQAGLDYSTRSPVKRILLTGADKFLNNIKPERILASEALGLTQPLLVYEMNGRPLPPKHGFPVRLIIQEGFGYKNVKWITEVQSINFDSDFGTYQDQGFVDDGVMRVNSRSTDLFEGRQVSAGSVMISGFALSGYAAIEKVEVQVDNQPVQQAEIVPLSEIQNEAALPPNIQQIGDNLPYPFKAVWTPWRFQWEATRGQHTVKIRAYDQEGNVQPDLDEDITDGQNGIATYEVTVV